MGDGMGGWKVGDGEGLGKGGEERENEEEGVGSSSRCGKHVLRTVRVGRSGGESRK